jgi:5-methylcytosine-specific restriction endonuclease McrA
MFNIDEYKKHLKDIGYWKPLSSFKNGVISIEDFIDAVSQFDQKPYDILPMSRASFSTYIHKIFLEHLKEKPAQTSPSKYLLHNYGFRRCAYCKDILTLSSFYKKTGISSNWDRLRNDCKYCESVETRLEQNKDVISLKAAKYRKNNKDKIKEYRQLNKEKINSYTANRRAKLKEQLAPSYNINEEIRYRKIATYLSKRYGEKYVLDHFIPLASGGLHEANNWQIITEQENLYKNKIEPIKFYTSTKGIWFLQNKKGIRKYTIYA